MRKSLRITGIIVAIIILVSILAPISAMAADEYIDVSNASQGSFSVYSSNVGAKMKVGVVYGGNTTFSDYTPGQTAVYSFANGDGSYTITLYTNVSGNSYRPGISQSVYVETADPNAQYLVSTNEISFSDNGAVGQKAAELSAGKSTYGKAIAFYNYIAGNFTYDRDFAAKVNSGEITNYTPNTDEVLESKSGVCYDFSALFAAMCRSQDIPCVITKGYLDGAYHAWNKICIEGNWYAVDLTYAVGANESNVSYFTDCITPLSGYTATSDSIPLSIIVG